MINIQMVQVSETKKARYREIYLVGRSRDRLRKKYIIFRNNGQGKLCNWQARDMG